MKEIETCERNCKFEDCIYRRYIETGIPICFYAAIMKESRKCSISNCDKYRTGKKKAKTYHDYIDWEINYDDDYF